MLHLCAKSEWEHIGVTFHLIQHLIHTFKMQTYFSLQLIKHIKQNKKTF